MAQRQDDNQVIITRIKISPLALQHVLLLWFSLLLIMMMMLIGKIRLLEFSAPAQGLTPVVQENRRVSSRIPLRALNNIWQ